MIDPPFIFVYGTLKNGFRANHKLERETLIGKGSTLDFFQMYDTGSFPIIFPSSPESHKHYRGRVTGEMYSLSPSTMKDLDWYEGYPDFYDRKVFNIGLIEEEIVKQAWMYYHPKFDRPPNVKAVNHLLTFETQPY